MKTVKVLIPVLLLILLASAVTSVLATERLVFDFAVMGNIDNPDQGVGAPMFLSLEGRVTLKTADYESGWSDSMFEDQWNHDEGQDEWWFTGPDGPGFFPGADGEQYRVFRQWWLDEHWGDEFIFNDYRWYSPRGSFDGKLVAMWSGGTASETYKVSLIPWKVERTLRDGFMYILGDSNLHESWDIWRQDGNGEVYEGHWEFDVGVEYREFWYWSENFRIYNNGKFQRKKTRLRGYLTIYYNTFEVTDPPEPDIHYDINGKGEFGPYQFQFGQNGS